MLTLMSNAIRRRPIILPTNMLAMGSCVSSRRGFLDQVSHTLEGIDELVLMDRVDRESRSFDSGIELRYDVEERNCIYDSLVYNLAQFPFGSTILVSSSLLGLFMFHTTSASYELTLEAA